MKDRYGRVFSEKTKTKIMEQTGESAHENFPESKYAIDFLMKVGTPIWAVKDGKVILVKNDSDRYGSDKKFAKDANFVAIDHGDGTFSEYVHLGKDKINVKIGQKVKEGDVLGYSGKSGYMSKPHLHLNIFKVENKKEISIPYASKLPELKEKGKGLEKVVGIIFIIGITVSLLFLTGITGNVIGTSNNNLYGLILIVIILICGGIWVFLRKK